MSMLQLESFANVPRNLPLKFHQNWVSNSWDSANIEFVSMVGRVRHENDFAYHPTPHPTQTQCQQYLSCYWPDFDETLKVGSWEPGRQIYWEAGDEMYKLKRIFW